MQLSFIRIYGCWGGTITTKSCLNPCQVDTHTLLNQNEWIFCPSIYAKVRSWDTGNSYFNKNKKPSMLGIESSVRRLFCPSQDLTRDRRFLMILWFVLASPASSGHYWGSSGTNRSLPRVKSSIWQLFQNMILILVLSPILNWSCMCKCWEWTCKSGWWILIYSISMSCWMSIT